MVPLTKLLLLSGILSGLLTICIEGTPASYDLHQTGELNVDTKVEDLQVLVAVPLKDEAMKILHAIYETLGMLYLSRGPTKTPDYDSEYYLNHYVDAVHTLKDKDFTVGSEKPQISHTEITDPEPALDRLFSRNRKSRKLIERGKKVRVDSTVKDLDQADDLTAKEEVFEAARPGISLKKQLSKKEEKELSALSEEQNELGNKRDELVLLGDGVENCGPGRYRDKSGTCQEDKDFY